MRTMIALSCCILANAAIAQEITVASKPAEVERLTRQLQKGLKELSPAAIIRECSPVVHEYAGTQDEIYGAFCSVSVQKKNFRLLMCDDRMVWKFTASLIYNLVSALPAETVVDFVRKNCPPGG
jgi:hypothetical protein